jgi:arachidonate 15-lipoxygenase
MNSLPSNLPSGQITEPYQYNYTYIEPVAMADQLPQSENFSLPWIVLTAKQALNLAINTLITNRGDHGEQGAEDDVREFLYQTLVDTIDQQGPAFKFKLVGALISLLPQFLPQTTAASDPKSAIAGTQGNSISDAEVANGIASASQHLLAGMPATGSANPAQPESLTNAESEAIKGVDLAVNQLLQMSSPATGTAAPRSDLPQAKVEVAKGIAASSLLESAAPTVATDQLDPAATATVATSTLQPALKEMSPSSKAEVAKGVETVLQGLLQGTPANAAEVEKFMNSNLVKVLGSDLLKPFTQNLLAGLHKQAPTGRPHSLEDYRRLFSYLKPPEIVDTFTNDEVFADLRLAGPNPLMIQRLTAADPRFPVLEEHYQSVMGMDDALQAAMLEGRIYLADYAILDGAINGTYGTEPETQKYGYAPLAMFAVPKNGGALRPVAIQCGQQPGNYQVITPSSSEYAWLIAKTVVQIADANVHEAVSHFGRTHLLIEPFVLATHRQLATTHPLFLLLVPHFQGTLAINDAAKGLLVAPKGGVNQLLSSTIDNSRVLAVKGLLARGFNAEMLPRRLQERGVDDPAVLPSYPYRDDGRLIWDAIHTWVENYLRLYYQSDDQVQGDASLQNWAAELVAFDGGRVQDFGDQSSGKITTFAYLTDAVTMIIFTSSAQHAAVNFPQNGVMSFAPAMPAAGYQPVKDLAAATAEDWLNLLPPLEQAQAQLNLLYLLGSVYFTKLGDYEADHFTDPGVAAPLQAFQQRLEAINGIIDQRNATRRRYEYLKPANIPQSINI